MSFRSVSGIRACEPIAQSDELLARICTAMVLSRSGTSSIRLSRSLEVSEHASPFAVTSSTE